jgi:secreted trypsin-like serine protease
MAFESERYAWEDANDYGLRGVVFCQDKCNAILRNSTTLDTKRRKVLLADAANARTTFSFRFPTASKDGRITFPRRHVSASNDESERISPTLFMLTPYSHHKKLLMTVITVV